MKKSLLYVAGGLVSLIALFFSYSTIVLDFAAGIPTEAQEMTKQAVMEDRGGSMGVSFCSFITDFSDKTTFWSTLSVIFVVLSIVCVVGIFIAGALSLIKKDKTIIEKLKTKWLSIAAFVLMALALAIGFIFPDFPEGMPGVFEIGAAIGLGSIIYLVATAVTSITQFMLKE